MATNNTSNFGTGTSGQVLTSNGSGVAPTFQAAAANAGVSSMPAWANVNSNLWWSPTPYTGLGSLGLTTYTVYLMPFLTYGAFTLTAVGIICGTYLFAPTSIEFGLFSRGGNLITSLGTLSVTASGLFTITGLSQSVPAGWYYIGFQPNNNFSSYRYARAQNTICGVNKVDTGATASQIWYPKGSAGLPSSIPGPLLLSTDGFVILLQGV